MKDLKIRRYKTGEEETLWTLYYNTTHKHIREHYTQEQCERWAPNNADMNKWQKRLKTKNPFIAISDNEILGFSELGPDGHIDFFYCHHLYLRKGVGRKLYEAIETEAIRTKIKELNAEVSIPAQRFFTKMGFEVIKQQNNIICGAPAPNYLMTKKLST